jgi:hypothetical protein
MSLVSLHLFTLAATALIIVYSDHRGFRYFLGKEVTLPARFLFWSHTLVWIGLVGMIITGVLMVLPIWTYYFQNPAFFVKMGFVVVLMINAYAIGVLSKTASERPFSALSASEKRILFISGGLSIIGWTGAVLTSLTFL